MTETPKPHPIRKKKKEDRPWSKAFLPDQGPKINGSELKYTTSSSKSMLMPEARP